MKAHFFSSNFTENGVWRTNEEFSSWNFVRLLKGEIPRATGTAWVDGARRPFSTREDALQIFADWAKKKFPYRSLVGCLIPVPSSKTTVSAIPPVWAALDMAKAVQAALPWKVEIWDGLRLAEEMQSWRDTNRRDPEALRDNLRAINLPLPWGGYVLVDDALTTGGHAIVSRDFLKGNGYTVSTGIFASRTCISQTKRPSNPFVVPSEDL